MPIFKGLTTSGPVSGSERTDSVEEQRGQTGRMTTFEAGLIAFGAALNVAVGYLVSMLKLPLYLDSIGTILIAALCGWRYGMIVGFAALAVLSVTSTPTVITYAGTVIVIAVCASLLERFGFLHTVKATVIGGLMLGLLLRRWLPEGTWLPRSASGARAQSRAETPQVMPRVEEA